MSQTGRLGKVYRDLCNLILDGVNFNHLNLSDSLGLPRERFEEFLDLLEGEGSLSRDPVSGRILACHPFSVEETPYIVQTMEWARFANSALESLSISYLLDEPALVRSVCPCKNEMILLDLKGQEIQFVDPSSLCILEKEPDCQSPFESPGIPETIFFCGRRPIGKGRERQDLREGKVVDLVDALQSLPDRLEFFPWAAYLRKRGKV